jgi:hypothetical protein
MENLEIINRWRAAPDRFMPDVWHTVRIPATG